LTTWPLNAQSAGPHHQLAQRLPDERLQEGDHGRAGPGVAKQPKVQPEAADGAASRAAAGAGAAMMSGELVGATTPAASRLGCDRALRRQQRQREHKQGIPACWCPPDARRLDERHQHRPKAGRHRHERAQHDARRPAGANVAHLRHQAAEAPAGQWAGPCRLSSRAARRRLAALDPTGRQPSRSHTALGSTSEGAEPHGPSQHSSAAATPAAAAAAAHPPSRLSSTYSATSAVEAQRKSTSRSACPGS
jgi:hypothetical protein